MKTVIIFIITILSVWVAFPNTMIAQIDSDSNVVILQAKLERVKFRENDRIKLILTLKNKTSGEITVMDVNTVTDFDIRLTNANGKTLEILDEIIRLKNPEGVRGEMLYFQKNKQHTWQIDNLKDYFEDLGVGKYKLKVSRKYYLGNIEKILYSSEIKFKVVK